MNRNQFPPPDDNIRPPFKMLPPKERTSQTLLKNGGKTDTKKNWDSNGQTLCEFEKMRKSHNDARDVSADEHTDHTNHDELIRERIVTYAINIKVEKNRYTTLITMKFRIKHNDRNVNPPYLHYKIFKEIKMVHPTAKLITNKETVYNEPKELSEGGKYINELKTTKETNAQYNSLRVCVNHTLELSILFKMIS